MLTGDGFDVVIDPVDVGVEVCIRSRFQSGNHVTTDGFAFFAESIDLLHCCLDCRTHVFNIVAEFRKTNRFQPLAKELNSYDHTWVELGHDKTKHDDSVVGNVAIGVNEGELVLLEKDACDRNVIEDVLDPFCNNVGMNALVENTAIVRVGTWV